MKKTRSDLPLWAKIIFETPELVSEIVNAISNGIKRCKLRFADYLIKTSELNE